MEFPSEFFYGYPQNTNYSTVDQIQNNYDDICGYCSSDNGNDDSDDNNDGDNNDGDDDYKNHHIMEEKGPITMGQKYTVKYNMDYTYTYCCNFCNYWTKKQSTMCMHYAIKHRSVIEKTSKCKNNGSSSNGDLYECSHCQCSFPVKSKLQQHIKNHHTKSSQYVCPYETCGREFKQKGSLICHVVRYHMPKKSLYYFDSDRFFKKQYVCISCKKRFTRNAIIYHVGKCSPLSFYQY